MPMISAGTLDAESGLVVHLTDRGEGPVFDRFFRGYDRAFVLPDEKEDEEGLRAALDLNHGEAGARLAARYGPFREICLVADGNDGTPVGGANFIAMPSSHAPVVTANLSYVYVEPKARGSGNLRRLIGAVQATMAQLFAGQRRARVPLIFLEQNDPFRMSPEAYARDTRFTGLDQLDRLRIWNRLGARLIDFPYVQPPLSDHQGPDDGLTYSVLGWQQPALPPQLLRAHLAGFFGISVLKEKPLDGDPAAREQMRVLAEMIARGEEIPLLDSATLLEELRSPRDLATRRDRISSLRDAIHRF